MKYVNEIQEQPDHHLCNVIREVGQGIQSLDLALPFVCSHIFVPQQQKSSPTRHSDCGEVSYPTISREPEATLPIRLIEAGYRYRRLICWDGLCRSGGQWEEMQDLANAQGEKISWEIVSAQEDCGSWHVSGSLPVTFTSEAVLERQLTEAER